MHAGICPPGWPAARWKRPLLVTESAEECDQSASAFLDREQIFGPSPASRPERAGKFSIAENSSDAVGKFGRLTLWHEQAGRIVHDHLGDSRQVGRNHWQARRHRLHHNGRQIVHSPARFGDTRQDKKMTAGEIFYHFHLRQWTK